MVCNALRTLVTLLMTPHIMLKYRMAYLYSGPVFLTHRPSTSSAMETA